MAAAITKQIRDERNGVLDVLINNAGTFSSWFMTTDEGFELQLAVNHLAPFLLTHQLMPLLMAAPAGRVISVSSGSHYGTIMYWKDLQLRKHYNSLWAYKQSKLANVLFIAELDRQICLKQMF
ncbi:MAG TPA: SDR family NAD(P)-dependent oxidoreductase [Firmicutes bacterium]|nr:SDR family NAD(P)-dependent oxidoreductase [Bacillota bacterium]